MLSIESEGYDSKDQSLRFWQFVLHTFGKFEALMADSNIHSETLNFIKLSYSYHMHNKSKRIFSISMLFGEKHTQKSSEKPTATLLKAFP